MRPFRRGENPRMQVPSDRRRKNQNNKAQKERKLNYGKGSNYDDGF